MIFPVLSLLKLMNFFVNKDSNGKTWYINRKTVSYLINNLLLKYLGVQAVQVALTTEKGKIKFDPDILGKKMIDRLN